MTVEYTPEALKDLKKLGKQVARQIFAYMDNVAKMKNPRDRGKALKGNLSEYWRTGAETIGFCAALKIRGLLW